MINVFDKSDYSIRKSPIQNIKILFRHLKYARQRIRCGFSDMDVWDVDDYLNDVIPGMLEKLLKDIDVLGGFPGSMVEAYYKEHKDEIGCEWGEFLCQATDNAKAWNERMEKECSEKWKSIIKKMIFLFHEQNYDTCSVKNTFSWEDDSEREEWRKREAEIDQYRSVCRAKAFAMLAEWYDCLWT